MGTADRATQPSEFLMPSLGADMDSGTVLEWLVKPGDPVRRGQVVAVIDTSKSAIDVESFVDGVVEDLVVLPGCEVPVGTVLAHIGKAPANEPPPSGPEQPEVRPPADVRVATPLVRHLAHRLGVDLATLTGSGPDGVITRQDVERVAARGAPTAAPAGTARDGVPARVRSSPYARRLAHERGLDLADLAGTGPGDAVVARDVAQPGRGAREPGSAQLADAATDRRRAAVAKLMARSKREIPHFYLTTTVDMAAAVDWLHHTNADRTVAGRLLPAALLLRATVRAAREHPHLCGHWRDGAFHRSPAVHLGVAVSLRDGSLIAPRISDADELSVDDLMALLRGLVQRARSGRLQRDEMAEPAITVTNLGDLGVDSVLPVIYPPQVAMIGFGRIVERPWAVGGLLGVRPSVEVTLAADHRASDGHRGGLFLSSLADFLQAPEEL